MDIISHQTQVNTILLAPRERGSSQTQQDAAKGTRLLPGLPQDTLTQRRQLLHLDANKEKRYFNPQQLLGLALTGFRKAKSCQHTMEKQSPWNLWEEVSSAEPAAHRCSSRSFRAVPISSSPQTVSSFLSTTHPQEPLISLHIHFSCDVLSPIPWNKFSLLPPKK